MKAEIIEATPDKFLEMARSGDWRGIDGYPRGTKFKDYEIGLHKGKRVIFDPFGHRNK